MTKLERRYATLRAMRKKAEDNLRILRCAPVGDPIARRRAIAAQKEILSGTNPEYVRLRYSVGSRRGSVIWLD